jgi:hypothetical protein
LQPPGIPLQLVLQQLQIVLQQLQVVLVLQLP